VEKVFLESNEPKNKHFSFVLGTLQGLCFIVGVYYCKKVADQKELLPISPKEIQRELVSPKVDDAQQRLLEDTGSPTEDSLSSSPIREEDSKEEN